MLRLHRDERGQSLVIVLSLITLLFLLGSALAVHASVALRATRTSAGQGNNFYAADAATELGIWWQRNKAPGTNPPAQTINGVTTSTTITTAVGGGGSCPATAPTVAWMSGFETGALFTGSTDLGGGFYSVAGGSGTADTVSSPVRTGNYALRIHPPTAGWNNYAFVQQPWGVALGPIVVAHFAVRFDVLPNVDSLVASVETGFSGSWTYPQLYLFYRASTGKWAVSMGSTFTGLYALYQESSITAVAGTWHTFDLRWNAAANPPTPRAVEWYVDDAAQPTLSVMDGTATAGAPAIYFGQDGMTTSTYTAYYDDAVISSTSSNFPIGDVSISPLVPNGMGTHNTPGNFQNNDLSAIDATTPGRVDDSPLNTITDFIKQVTASATSYIELNLADSTQTCIRGANAVMAVHNVSGTSGNSTKASIFDGSTETVIWSGSIGSASITYAQRPITPGGAWDQTRVNGLKARVGYGSDVNPVPAWDGVFVEYAWRTVGGGGPATVTIVGTGGASTVTTTYPDAGAGVPTLSTWTTTK